MKNFDTRVYSLGDFLEWNSSGLLELSPDFQRRSVWTKQAKSYLADTVLSGKPMPKILMTQKLEGARTKRIIIDGQQRLRALLEFCNDEFTISRSHSAKFANKIYSNLPPEIQRDLLKYELGVDLLFDLSYEETLDIFARLNTYSVRLTKQELFNAKYLGSFKQTAYKIGYSYVKYWLQSGIITRAQVSRMAEAELASDILVASIDGIQTNKQLEKYYRKYEEESNDLSVPDSKAREALDVISAMYPNDELESTNFSRIHLYYSLFCAVFHCLFKLKDFDAPRLTSIKKKTGRVRVALDDFSARYDQEDSKIAKFIDASRRATTDVSNRRYRAKILAELISGV